MPKISILLTTVFVLSILLLGLTIGDYLALHDIQNDYVSPTVLESQGIATALPDWTSAPLEWTMVTISIIARGVFLIANIFILWFLLRKTKQKI